MNERKQHEGPPMTSTLLQQAVEALTRAHAFVLNGVSLAEPVDETMPVIEAALAALVSTLQQPMTADLRGMARFAAVQTAIDSLADGDARAAIATLNGILADVPALQQQPEPVGCEWPKCDCKRPMRCGKTFAPPALQQQEEPRGAVIPPAPPECETEDEKTAFAFGYWQGLNAARKQQEEPREVMTEKLLELALSLDDSRLPLATRAAYVKRELALICKERMASPSPQDFTLPMLEDVHGVVCGGDGGKVSGVRALPRCKDCPGRASLMCCENKPPDGVNAPGEGQQ